MLRVFADILRQPIMSAVQKPEVLFVLGRPGSGKGTLCRYIVEKYGYVHLSAGDLLREERSRPGSRYGELIETYIKNGQIVPVEITCSLLDQAMQTNKGQKGRFLIDGFPRNQNNVDGWNRMMSEKVNLKGVLFCECSQEVCTERCLNRGAKGSGRSDDNEESLIKRHETYMNNTLPIIQYYEEKAMVYKVNGMKTPDEVFQEVQNKILPQIGW